MCSNSIFWKDRVTAFVVDKKLRAFIYPEEGCSYAFYHYHSKGITKKYYTSENSVVFNNDLKVGLNKVQFFIKNWSGDRFSKTISYFLDDKYRLKPIDVNIIAEGPNYKIEHYSNSSEVVFIVFNGSKTTKNHKPFALEYLLKKGWDVIACYQDNNTQYQELSLDVFYTSVINKVKGKNVFCYGSSLGGYCAVYYGGSINATIISAAPRNSAHPSLYKYSKEYADLDFKHSEIADNNKTSNKVYLLVDPYVKQDVAFLESCVDPAYPEAVKIEINHAGHQVLYHLNETNQLNDFISNIVAGREFQLESTSSCYKEAGLARWYMTNKDYKKAMEHIENAISYDHISHKFIERFLTMREKIRRKIEDDI